MITLCKYKTEKNADSVEFCPHEPHQDIFVCGNYQLDEKNQETSKTRRSGRILLFSFTIEDNLTLLQTVECVGVLDMKWCHNKINDRSILGVANAENSIEIYKLTMEKELELVTKIVIESELELLILSLDWSTGKYESESPTIVCSDSKGFVHTLHFENDRLSRIDGYKSHDFECWIVAFNYFHTEIFYSGGDDAVFLTHDMRNPEFNKFKNKSHQAGVTSIHSNSKREHLIATGSYDSFLRLWDDRNLKDFVSTMEMPGTLWRLKWDPFKGDKLITACMLGGAHVVEVDVNGKSKIIRSYDEHESLVYGIDWSWVQRGNVNLIGTCSFYDNLLCLTKFDSY